MANEITQADWEFLWRYYFLFLKVVYTEHADLDKIEASFPANAGEGGMVGDHETLPFAWPVSITAAEKGVGSPMISTASDPTADAKQQFCSAFWYPRPRMAARPGILMIHPLPLMTPVGWRHWRRRG